MVSLAHNTHTHTLFLNFHSISFFPTFSFLSQFLFPSSYLSFSVFTFLSEDVKGTLSFKVFLAYFSLSLSLFVFSSPSKMFQGFIYPSFQCQTFSLRFVRRDFLEDSFKNEILSFLLQLQRKCVTADIVQIESYVLWLFIFDRFV